MPIRCSIQPVPISRDEYHNLDYRVMGIMFGIHNEMGRLCDERIYQAAIAKDCRKEGMDVAREIPIKVSYQTFEKVYLADMIVNSRILYEIKAADAITPAHKRQTLNYMFLTNFQWGKLANMRPVSVMSEYVTTTLTSTERYRFEINTTEWLDLDPDSAWLRQLMECLLKDWGSFINADLFGEAVAHFQGQPPDAVSSVAMSCDGVVVGMQRARLLNPRIGMAFSAVTEHHSDYETHLRRFLAHTSLEAMQWFNFDHHNILMKTLVK